MAEKETAKIQKKLAKAEAKTVKKGVSLLSVFTRHQNLFFSSLLPPAFSLFLLLHPPDDEEEADPSDNYREILPRREPEV